MNINQELRIAIIENYIKSDIGWKCLVKIINKCPNPLLAKMELEKIFKIIADDPKNQIFFFNLKEALTRQLNIYLQEN